MIKRFDVLDIKLNNKNAKFLRGIFKDEVPDIVKKLYSEKLYSCETDNDFQHGLLNHILASDFLSKICVTTVNDNCEQFIKVLLLLQKELPGSVIYIDRSLSNNPFYSKISKQYVNENITDTDKPITFLKGDTYANNENGEVIYVSSSTGMVADRHIILTSTGTYDKNYCNERGIYRGYDG